MTKLSLSKKGFDTENGGGPSPILADGRMVSLPIPEPRDEVCATTYEKFQIDKRPYAALIRKLGYDIKSEAPAHLDPDLVQESVDRIEGWRGMFGQVDQAESHLQNQGVGPHALFLFWGWFAPINEHGRLVRSKSISAIYGYLEVDYALQVGVDAAPDFARQHPHFSEQYPRENNRTGTAAAGITTVQGQGIAWRTVRCRAGRMKRAGTISRSTHRGTNGRRGSRSPLRTSPPPIG